MLKTLSEATLVTHTQRYFFAKIDRHENWCDSCFHHSMGFESMAIVCNSQVCTLSYQIVTVQVLLEYDEIHPIFCLILMSLAS